MLQNRPFNLPRSFRIRTMLVATMVVCVGLVLKLNFDRWQRLHNRAEEWVQPYYRQTLGNLRLLTISPTKMSEKEQLEVLEHGILRLSDRRKRTAALALLIKFYPERTFEILTRLIPKQRDPAVLATMIRLISLRRHRIDLELMEPLLGHRDEKVRAAALDAIGVIRRPGYSLGWTLDTVPPIFAQPLTLDTPPETTIPLSPTVRRKIERAMIEGKSRSEREAAARSLIAWPPEDYRLRVAEWGVWLSDNSRLDLIEEVLDEIPPFVHRTGNEIVELSARVRQPLMAVTKPVVHVTVDRPLVLDLSVNIAEGRPWFAYPLPDDFTLETVSWNPPRTKEGKPLVPAPGARLVLYDRPAHGKLLQPREGFPWLAQRHRIHEAASLRGGMPGGMPRGMPIPSHLIRDVGLRWQSLIVTPERHPWMNVKAFEGLKEMVRYHWWEDLRDVPSSWITSRGETERFVYYDGPSRAKSPVQVTLRDGGLEFVHRKMFDLELTRNESPHAAEQTGPDVERRGMFLDVPGDGSSIGRPMTIRPDTTRIEIAELPALKGEAIANRLLQMFVEFGLTKQEAQGLIDAWRKRFVETPGRRMLMLLKPDEYDAVCPLTLRPQPTELVRLGIVLTEL